MKLQQLSLFLENRPGRLDAPLEAIAAAGINILTLSLADTAQFGILRLIVRDWDKAKQVLEDGGWVVNLTEVVAVDVEDRPGGLAEVLKVLDQAGVNIEYMYAFSSYRPDKAILIFRFEDPDQAVKVLLDQGIRALDGDELIHADG
ncbi:MULTISPECIES: ACT domain-containing protein [Thiorhodovibrio]|uniref:ACT domain-containing protein n=1 Tax=Thiorhodovibrio frisius TaxID=631362 RepID=H8YXC1_9GAMM|nr:MULTISPECIES: ACT domain-containing protein [Thiorhodovibrio]EIC23097.1 ACT domain-containing protein [Thiorhodovibrio frisius]MBK5969723.1 amino acid-binding protein [Thiorhodovibrio winogradskyi]WPL13772.1 ACT domain-containing protein [Thiorhodovibrio litoralis]WPL22639.1 ACT domain-containing protein [Thiorhodovibrio frisius]